MISVAPLLLQEFELLKAELTEAYLASDTAVTGNWAQTLEVKAQGNNAKLMGAGYIKGRKPGTPPPSHAIEQWIVTKGIAAQMENNISISSLAYLIARKIGREGWQPKQENIIQSIATPARIQQIIDKAGTALLPGFVQDITNHLKTLAA